MVTLNDAVIESVPGLLAQPEPEYAQETLPVVPLKLIVPVPSSSVVAPTGVETVNVDGVPARSGTEPLNE